MSPIDPFTMIHLRTWKSVTITWIGSNVTILSRLAKIGKNCKNISGAVIAGYSSGFEISKAKDSTANHG